VKKLIAVALVAAFLASAGIGCNKDTKTTQKATEAGGGSTKTTEKMK
jgi:hypothetical protein